MVSKTKLALVGVPVVGLGLFQLCQGYYDVQERQTAVDTCRAIAQRENKPWLNFGAGNIDWGGLSHNADIRSSPDMPNFILIPEEPPYPKIPSNSYSCVLAMHVLEHIKDWKGVYRELIRIAGSPERVIVVVPRVDRNLVTFAIPTHYWLWFEPFPAEPIRNPFYSSLISKFRNGLGLWPGSAFLNAFVN